MNRFVSRDDYATQADVEAEYPGAAVIVEVDGGWMVFETVTDFEIWHALDGIALMPKWAQ